VERLFETHRPKRVLHLAAEEGGVKANAEKNSDFLELNLRINLNVLGAAQKFGVTRLVSILSSCAFHFYTARPSTEHDLHAGLPFDGNLGYGYSKRVLDVQTQLLSRQYGSQFSTLAPVTLYGPHDNCDLDGGHVIGSLIHKCFLAKQENKPFEVWGSGNATRQFLYSFDLAKILLKELDSFDGPETTVIAPNDGIAIRDLAHLIAQAMNFSGPIIFDSTKPEGQLVKVLKSNRFSRRFPDFSFTSLEDGLKATAEWFSIARREGVFA